MIQSVHLIVCFPLYLSCPDPSISDPIPSHSELSSSSTPPETTSKVVPETESSTSIEILVVQPTVRPSRVKHLPSRFKDFTGLPSSNVVLPSQSPESGKSPIIVTYPIQNHLSYDTFTPKYQAYLTTVSKIPTPYTFNQVAPDPNWFQAMKTEIAALEENHTWDIVEKPPYHHLVDCK